MAGRDPWIDLLRALSACWVALFHLTVISAGAPPGLLAQSWRHFCEHGHLGVPIFFALSGYCTTPGWLRSTRTADFLLHRLARILLPYWCSLALVLAVALGAKTLAGVNDVAPLPRDARAIFATLLILTDPLTAVPRLNWVYWTLTPVLAYALGAGLLVSLRNGPRLATLAAGHVLLCTADLVLQPAGDGWLMLVKYWPMFGLGLAGSILPANRPVGLVMLATSAVHLLLSQLTGHDGAHYALVAALTLAVLGVSRGRRAPAGLERLAGLGRISYSLYLVHVPLGVYVFHRWLPVRFGDGWQYLGSQLLLLGLCLVSAAGFHQVAEKPFASLRLKS